MHDEIFAGSVIYLTEHSANGVIGVIVNKPISHSLDSAFKNVDIGLYNPEWIDSPLYFGGPVNPERGFVLHKNLMDDYGPNELILSNEINVLEEIAQSSKHNESIFMAVGYCTWMYMQLENEIRRNSWLVVGAEEELIFNTDPANRYSEALKMLGIGSLGHLYYSNNITA
jgi:putative transcriptional regulator